MRIAFAHNLRIRDDEAEGDFDAADTVAAIIAGLSTLGHEVEPIEVSGPVAPLVARLEALSPDLVFNTACGRFGRGREAFYPDLFEQLGLAFTGSDAQATAISRDKRLCKSLLSNLGLPTPRFVYVSDARDLASPDLRYPLIVKPNFEGSSKGVTHASVVDDAAALVSRVRSLLEQYPAGLIIEEFVTGRDLVVPFFARPSAKTGDLLGVGEFVMTEAYSNSRRHPLYEYELKHEGSAEVAIRMPAELPSSLAQEAIRLTRRAVDALELRGFARLDLRLTPEGRLTLLSVNAMPSLHLGGAMHRGAQAFGLTTYAQMLETIVKAAVEDHHLVPRPAARRSTLRVGLTFNLKRVIAKSPGDDDSQAEYDSPATIASIRSALESFGHDVVELEATPELPALLGASKLDVVFNLAEGQHGRNRESQVPALCELLSIPYSGSDPATLSLTLDKGLAKRIVRQHGVPTPEFLVMRTGNERLPPDLRLPAIAKPVAEGSSKGVIKASVVKDEVELRALAREIIGKYKQGALVETFLPGREFTVGLLGEKRPRVLPPLEIVFLKPQSEHPVYSFEHKQALSDEVRYDAPANLDARLLAEIESVAREAFVALGCRDVARIDLRLDAAGRVNFIECNPLTGLTPDWSDLCMIAKSAGMAYRDLVGEILAPAIRRFNERKRRPAGARRG